MEERETRLDAAPMAQRNQADEEKRPPFDVPRADNNQPCLLSGTSEELLDLGDMRDERPPPLPHIPAHPQGPLPLSCVFNGWHNDLMYVTVERRTPQQAC